jgi:hypothetical protein
MPVKERLPLAAHARFWKEFVMDQQQHISPSFWKTPFGIGATIAAVALSFYLWGAHKDHVLALLPFAFLAACPLMHMFMHRGHRDGSHSHRTSQQVDGPPRS